MAVPTWRDLDAQRKALPRRLSRAKWSRRSGVSESTITKGIATDSAPTKSVREKVQLVLEAARVAAEAGIA